MHDGCGSGNDRCNGNTADLCCFALPPPHSCSALQLRATTRRAGHAARAGVAAPAWCVQRGCSRSGLPKPPVATPLFGPRAPLTHAGTLRGVAGVVCHVVNTLPACIQWLCVALTPCDAPIHVRAAVAWRGTQALRSLSPGAFWRVGGAARPGAVDGAPRQPQDTRGGMGGHFGAHWRRWAKALCGSTARTHRLATAVCGVHTVGPSTCNVAATAPCVLPRHAVSTRWGCACARHAPTPGAPLESFQNHVPGPKRARVRKGNATWQG